MRRYLYATTCYALVIVALHFFSGHFPPLSSWGFYHLNQYSGLARIFFYFAALAVCLPSVNSILSDVFLRIANKVAKLRAGISPHIVYLMVSALAGVLFWWLRSGNVFLGDGVTVSKIANSDEAFKYYVGGWAGHITSHQVLDFWVGHNLHKILFALLHFEPYETIALLSCVAGVIFCFAVLEIAHLLWDDWGRRLGFAAVIFSAGVTQLFFGYVETYSLATAVLALFCLCTLMYARGRCGMWLPAVLLALSGSLHMLTLGAGLALLFAYMYRSRMSGKYKIGEFAWMAIVPALIVAIYFVIFHSMGFSAKEIFFSGQRQDYEGVFFLSLSRRGYQLERYTLFSAPHLVDIANEILLASPFGLFLCVLSFPRFLKSKYAKEPEALIFLLTCVTYLFISFTVAPLLGARKDWDVFAPPSIFVTMLGAYMMMHANEDTALLRRILTVVVSVSLVCSIPWIVSNHIDLKKYMQHRGDGDMFQREGMTEKAIESYQKALGIVFTPELAYQVAGLEAKSGRLQEAADLLKKSIREENRSELALFLEQEDAYFVLGTISLKLGRTDEAIEEFKKSIELAQSRPNATFIHLPDVYYHLGVAYMGKGEYETAENAFLLALKNRKDMSAAQLALGELYARDPGKAELARVYILKYLESNPTDSQAAELLEKLPKDFEKP